MQWQSLFPTLPDQYQGWNTEAIQPQDPSFAEILKQVPGMTTANVLQLLNWAVGGA